MAISSNGTPALVNVATPSNAMTVTGTFPTGSSPAANDLIVCVVTLYGTAAATTIAQHSGTTGYSQALTITGTTCRVDYWTKTATNFGVPYIPNVTMGWDSSPRADQSQRFDNSGYPFMNTIKDNTPENFRTALKLAKQRLLDEPTGLRILNLNCWNEWTEGSYLEPDTVHGMAYLDAIREVFGDKTKQSGQEK